MLGRFQFLSTSSVFIFYGFFDQGRCWCRIILLLYNLGFFVWIHYIYIYIFAAERGLGTSHLLISFLLIILEYNWRYRGESFFAPFRGTALGYLISLFVGKYFL